MAESKERQSIQLRVIGMTCAACVRRVERAISKVEGVENANVNLATELADISFETGKSSPEQIQAAIEKAGYDAALINPDVLSGTEPSANDTEREVAQLNRLFRWSCIFTIPLFCLSMIPMLSQSIMDVMMRWMPMQTWNIVALILCLPVQFGIGARFYRQGWKSLRGGSPDMNALVMIGTSAAFLYSLVVTLFPFWVPIDAQHIYFESAAVVITLVLLGKWLEVRARGQASNAMQSLLQLQPSLARVLRNGRWDDVLINEIVVGEVLEVRPGESVPLDSEVISGSSFVNESMVTGESMPRTKLVGDSLIGGTLNGNGCLQSRVTATVRHGTLSKITEFIRQAQASKPNVQSLADRVVAVFVPLVLLVAILTFFGWWFMSENGFERGCINAATVLIVACPCAMGLAVPTSIMVASGTAARLGILFRSGQAIESLSQVNAFAFDKTGTLTLGKPVLLGVDTTAKWKEDELLAMLVNIQRRSEHPMAVAVLEAAKQRKIEPVDDVTAFEAHPGFGVSAILSSGQRILVGSNRFLSQQGVRSSHSDIVDKWIQQGAGVFYVAIDGYFAGSVAVRDSLKPTSAAAIRQLNDMGFKTYLISGDSLATARYVGQNVGIEADSILAEVSPERKGEVVQQLQLNDMRVAFVGDGINDGPALAASDVGIAIGSGTDLAIESADIVLMSDELTSVCTGLIIAQATIKNIKQNLFWAFGYNALLIPVASGLLEALWNVRFSPMYGAMAMSISSVMVVSNALRLRHTGSRKFSSNLLASGTKWQFHQS